MSSWEVWLCSPSGYRKKLLDTTGGFQVSRIANTPGAFRLMLPPSFDRGLLTIDSIVEFWRAPAGGKMARFRSYFIRKIEIVDQGGTDNVYISGPDSLDLLRRRIVAYAAGNASALITDQADDMLKTVVDVNLGANATDTNRIFTGVTVAGDLAAAPELTKGFAWRNVLAVCQDIAEASRSLGTDLFFDFEQQVTSTSNTWTFVTATGQPGQDRTITGGGVVFGKEWGNLYDANLSYDYTTEANYIYCAGQGWGANRATAEVYDAQRLYVSPYERCEGFADGRNMTTAAALEDAAFSKLAELRPRVRFSGRLEDTTQTRYGVDWNYGDKVNITYAGVQFAAVIRAVQFNVNGDGSETIEARVESTETLTTGAAVAE